MTQAHGIRPRALQSKLPRARARPRGRIVCGREARARKGEEGRGVGRCKAPRGRQARENRGEGESEYTKKQRKLKLTWGAISLKLSTHVQQEVVGDAEPRQRTQIVLACRRRR